MKKMSTRHLVKVFFSEAVNNLPFPFSLITPPNHYIMTISLVIAKYLGFLSFSWFWVFTPTVFAYIILTYILLGMRGLIMSSEKVSMNVKYINKDDA